MVALRSETIDDSYKYVRPSGSPKFKSSGSVTPAKGVVVYPPPGDPTAHAPGTAEKLAVIEKRAKRKEATCHPFDARYEGDLRVRFWFALSKCEREIVVREQMNDAQLPLASLV